MSRALENEYITSTGAIDARCEGRRRLRPVNRSSERLQRTIWNIGVRDVIYLLTEGLRLRRLKVN